MNSGMGMSTRPASANQNAAQAAGLERCSTEEDMLQYLVSAARSSQPVRPVLLVRLRRPLDHPRVATIGRDRAVRDGPAAEPPVAG